MTGRGVRGRATLKDVARLAGVSASTASRVLNGAAVCISQAARERVARAARLLDYQPNAIARSLRTRESQMIGLILPDVTNPFFAEVAKGVQLEARCHGYRVILCNSGDDPEEEAEYLRLLAAHQVDGVVCITASGSMYWELQAMARSGTPVVLVDRQIEGFTGDVVRTDGAHGAAVATQHLIALGHDRIVMLAGPGHLSTTKERVMGFRRAMEEHGGPIDNDTIVELDFTFESGYSTMIDLLSRGIKVTAVLCGNDLIAAAAIQAGQVLGRSVPDTLAVVGFDDIFIASLWKPSITTIAQPKADLGSHGVRLVHERRCSPGMEPRCFVLPPRLVIRESCGARAQNPDEFHDAHQPRCETSSSRATRGL